MVNKLNIFSEKIIQLPRKIDIYNYSTFQGGEFFQSLLVLSCPNTRKVILQNSFQMLEPDDVVPISRFKKIEYDGIRDFVRRLYLYRNLTPDDFILSLKFEITNGIMFSRKHIDWKDALVIFAGHIDFKSRKIRQISECEYWDMITMEPNEDFGRDLVRRMHENTKLRLAPEAGWDSHLVTVDGKLRYSFLENFPFIDYILQEKYDDIKYWIENRYGSHMNFDFIDASLKMWRKVRVEPYL